MKKIFITRKLAGSAEELLKQKGFVKKDVRVEGELIVRRFIL